MARSANRAPDDLPEPTGVELRVCQDIARRQHRGIEKYGHTVESNPLLGVQWLQHAYEESLDFAIYLRKCIEDAQSNIDNQQNPDQEASAPVDKSEES